MNFPVQRLLQLMRNPICSTGHDMLTNIKWHTCQAGMPFRNDYDCNSKPGQVLQVLP